MGTAVGAPQASSFRVNLPHLHHMPKYNGKKTGIDALDWFADKNKTDRIKRMHNIPEDQMANYAKTCCVDYAKNWAGTQPNQTFEDFKSAFRLQFGTHNYDQIYIEMTEHKQGKHSVGAYFTKMMRYFQQLDLVPQQQKIHFIKNLNPNVRDTVIMRAPQTAHDAIAAACEYETIYSIMPGEDLSQQIHAVSEGLDMPRTEVTRRRTESPTFAPNQPSLTEDRIKNMPCPKCLEYGHML
jgi:hypothetical protein